MLCPVFLDPEIAHMLSSLSRLSRLSRSVAHTGFAGVLLFTLGSAHSADDGYLREIDEEAKRQALQLQVAPTPTSSATHATTSSDEALASGLNQAQFEQALRAALPGTYALYQQFDAPHKQKTYAAYQQDARLPAISEQVIQLLSAKP